MADPKRECWVYWCRPGKTRKWQFHAFDYEDVAVTEADDFRYLGYEVYGTIRMVPAEEQDNG